MLKLEKTSHCSGLTIRMRERECFFEPRLLKALAIALFLHGSALFLFQVTPFYLSSTFTFPPIHVQSDQPLQGVSTLVTPYIEEDELLPPSLALIPAFDWISFSQESTLTPSLALDLYALQNLEEHVWPKWQEPLSIPLEEPSIQLAISGDLAQLSLITRDPFLDQMQPISSHPSPVYVNYQVQVDEKTGEIFWYERTESSGTPIDHLTEKILLNLRFDSTEFQEPIMGSLHFVILLSEDGEISHD